MGDKLKKFYSEHKETIEKVSKVIVFIISLIDSLVRSICKIGIFAFVVLFVVACISLGYASEELLPEVMYYKETANEKLGEITNNTFIEVYDTVIYDNAGEVLGEINVNNYAYVEIEDISDWVQLGYISVEDKNFLAHFGLDFKALLRASLALLQNDGEITQGGSTITQQVIKNNLLSQEQTFERKFIEFFLAPELEKEYTKGDIMEFYVNTNFYGNNCYGIETAALYYFGKNASDLTLAESALLVGVSNNPTMYNPISEFDNAKSRQYFVLGELYSDGVITETQMEDAYAEELEIVASRDARVKESYQVSYAVHCATISLMEKNGFEFKYTYTSQEEYEQYLSDYSAEYTVISNDIRSGGYTIYTSLDSEMQVKLQEIVDSRTSGYTAVADDGRYSLQAAGVIVNNDTGYVEAIVGGRGTEDEYNRGYLSKRQPGSSIKPLVAYAPGIDKGAYWPSKIMVDEPDEEDEYYPKNYDLSYMGNVTVREAVGRSLNTIAYQVLADLHPTTGLSYLDKMRFTGIAYEDNQNTAIALGGFTYGVSVADMAKGYSTLANEGTYIDNNCIISIEYQNEGTIFREDSAGVEVYDEDTAFLMIDVLKGVMTEYYGTGGSGNPSNATVFGKTGTSNDSKDVWFCGASDYYSLAVWAGYDIPSGSSSTSSSITSGIFKETMEYLHTDLERVDFVQPPGVTLEYVDYKGDLSNYAVTISTGTGEFDEEGEEIMTTSTKMDYFSKGLLSDSEAEAKLLEENKKVEEDNGLVDSIRNKLDELYNYIIEYSNYKDFLEETVEIRREIETVYQTDEQSELYSYLNKVLLKFDRSIGIFERTEEIELSIAEKQAEYDEAYLLVRELATLNNFRVKNMDSVEEFDSMVAEMEIFFDESSDAVFDKYYLVFLNIVDNKESYLEYYREMIYLEEEKAEQEAAALEELLRIEQEIAEKDSLMVRYASVYSSLENMVISYQYVNTMSNRSDVEDMESNIESQFTFLESVGINVDSLRLEYESKKERLEDIRYDSDVYSEFGE